MLFAQVQAVNRPLRGRMELKKRLAAMGGERPERIASGQNLIPTASDGRIFDHIFNRRWAICSNASLVRNA
jgi:hypothetical protein